MKKLIFIFILLSACGSPQNHRVLSDTPASSKATNNLAFSKNHLSVKTFWAEGPYDNVQKTSKLVVYVYDDLGALTSLGEGKELGFFAVMPSMGHALDQPGYFEEVSPGVYINREITFNMSGEWQMKLMVINAQGQLDEEITWVESF